MPMTCAERGGYYEERRDKALELLAVKGFGQVSMRELASHLGLTAGSLYHHFPSKQHLLFDLIEELFEELLATLQRPRRSAERRQLRLHRPVRGRQLRRLRHELLRVPDLRVLHGRRDVQRQRHVQLQW